MNAVQEKWIRALGKTSDGLKYGKATLTHKGSFDEFDYEIYSQENGKGKSQRVVMLFPKGIKTPAPVVIVPFYYPERMIGFNLVGDEPVNVCVDAEMMLQLVRRGYITVSAESYHLSYIESEKGRDDFTRWQDAADALRADHPEYQGIGKLVDDTRLLIDLVCTDARADKDRIGIAGHSLGGKMAFYTGCLDDRIKAILASDFGIGWDQTNWRDDWYWGSEVDRLIANGMDHTELLSAAAPKPFCLIAGEFDNGESYRMMLAAKGYLENDGRLKFINHATGHHPPLWALNEGYDFLGKFI